MRRLRTTKRVSLPPQLRTQHSASEAVTNATAQITSIAYPLSPLMSVAYKNTVPYPIDKLFTTNHRTPEFFATNEKQITDQLRSIFRVSHDTPPWLCTRAESTNASIDGRSIEEMSALLYKHLRGEGGSSSTALAATGGQAQAPLLTTVRNMLSLRSHHGLVLTDQLLVLSCLALCQPFLALRPETTIVSSPTDFARVLGDDNGISKLNATVPAGGTIPPAVSDILQVIAEEQRLPTHPLLIVALTALIRQVDASCSVSYIRYQGSSRGNATGQSTASLPDHLSHTVRYIIDYQLRPLLSKLEGLGMLIATDDSNEMLVKAYYGDGTAGGLSHQWFGASGVDASNQAACAETIDLLELFNDLCQPSVVADSMAFRRRSDGPMRQLSALEKSMLTTDPNPSATLKPSAGTGKGAFAMTTKTNIKVLHLKLLAAIAEVAATAAVPDICVTVLRTLLTAHGDVLEAAIATPVAGQLLIAERECRSLADTVLQMLGYGFYMCEYAGVASQHQAATPYLTYVGPHLRKFASTPIVATWEGMATGQSLADVATFQQAFPLAAGYWAALNGSTATMQASLASSSTTEEVRGILAHRAMVHMCKSYEVAFTLERELVELLPQAEVDAVVMAKFSEADQLISTLISPDGFLFADVLNPTIDRLHIELAKLRANSAQPEQAVATALRTVADAIHILLVDGPQLSVSGTPRIVSFVKERHDHLGGERVMRDDEYQLMADFVTQLMSRVMEPVLSTPTLLIQAPRAADLLLAAVDQVLTMVLAILQAENDTRAGGYNVESSAFEAFTALSRFIASKLVPSMCAAVVQTIKAAEASELAPSIGLVGSIINVSIKTDTLAVTMKAATAAVAPPLISSQIKPLIKLLFATHLAGHTEDLAQAAKVGAGTTTSDVLHVTRKKPSSSNQATLSGLMDTLPVAEAIQPLGAFVDLFEAARAAGDVELSLMLRSLRPSLFN